MCALLGNNSNHFFNQGQNDELYDLGFQSSDAEHHFISSADEHAHQISLQQQRSKKKKFRKTKHATESQKMILVDLPEGEEMTEEYYKQLFEQHYESPFTEFATGKLKISSQEEELLMKWMDRMGGSASNGYENSDNKENSFLYPRGTRKDFYSSRRWTPMLRYSAITPNIQSAFHRVYGKEHMAMFFADLESYLEDFILKEKNRVVLVFRDGYQRLLAHGIIKYYVLHSKSVDYKGQRMTVIQRSSRLKRLQAYAAKYPKKGKSLLLPKMRLYQYLSMLLKQSPQQIDRRVRSGETFKVQAEKVVSQLNVSDMESGFDSTHGGGNSTNSKKKKRKTRRKKATELGASAAVQGGGDVFE